MKQILEVGNIKTFVEKCSKLFSIDKDKVIEIEDFDEKSKFDDFIFISGFAIFKSSNSIFIIMDSTNEDCWEISKLQVPFDLFVDDTEIDNLYELLCINLQIQKEKQEDLYQKRLELKKIKVKEITQSLYSNLQIAVNKLKKDLPENTEVIFNAGCNLTLVLPPFNTKSGKVKIGIFQFNPDELVIEYKEPKGHPNDRMHQLTNTWVSKFKEIYEV